MSPQLDNVSVSGCLYNWIMSPYPDVSTSGYAPNPDAGMLWPSCHVAACWRRAASRREVLAAVMSTKISQTSKWSNLVLGEICGEIRREWRHQNASWIIHRPWVQSDVEGRRLFCRDILVRSSSPFSSDSLLNVNSSDSIQRMEFRVWISFFVILILSNRGHTR